MKKNAIILFSLAVLLTLSGNVMAQGKPTTSIADVKEDGQVVNIHLISSKPFIFGNNRYILHIGNNDFYLNKQSVVNGTGSLTFMIPAADFNAQQEGADMYVTYGDLTMENAELAELSNTNDTRCWSLGKFSKTLLAK